MATYRFCFYGFGELTVCGSTGQVGAVLSLPAVATFGTPGASFVLAADVDVMRSMLVEEVERVLQVAEGSGTGVTGQAVHLDCHLILSTDDPIPRVQSFFIVRLDDHGQGLIGVEPLRAGVTYTIDQVGHTDTLATLLSHPDREAAAALPREAVLCFTGGTRVDTPDGPRLIETLRPGDLVTTLGSGSQQLRWTGSRHVTTGEMLALPELQPVEFATGAIGNARPLRVSPQHRILLNDWRAQVFFGEDEVLVPAKALVNDHSIRQVLPGDGVTYIHLLFDRHEILLCEGALSESFHPGETGLQLLEEAQRRELEQLFPGLELARRRAAYPIVKLSEARALRLPE